MKGVIIMALMRDLISASTRIKCKYDDNNIRVHWHELAATESSRKTILVSDLVNSMYKFLATEDETMILTSLEHIKKSRYSFNDPIYCDDPIVLNNGARMKMSINFCTENKKKKIDILIKYASIHNRRKSQSAIKVKNDTDIHNLYYRVNFIRDYEVKFLLKFQEKIINIEKIFNE